MVKADGKFIVVEDAPAGIKAGKAANCQVIGLTTSHTIDQVLEAGSDWVVQNLDSVRFEKDPVTGYLMLHISNALDRG